VPSPEENERIRSIFLHDRPFVSIREAAALLHWSREQIRAALAGQEVYVLTASSGKVIPRDELIALALQAWPLEWIEEALGPRAGDVLPEPIRSCTIALRIPRFQVAMLDYLAEQQHTTAGHLVSRALDDLAGEHLATLAPAIRGFADAVAWTHGDDFLQLC